MCPVTSIRSRCDDCGVFRVSAQDVTVRARVTAIDFAWRIICPYCGARIVRQTDEQKAYLLLDAGCPIEWWTLPYRGPRLGPPITMADILAFVLDFEEWSHADS